jgi:hypothetical protein
MSKRIQNFFFINKKLKKYENLNVFYMCLIVPYYYKKIEDEINCIMKIKGHFMKIMSLNKVIKHPLLKPNFDIGILFDSF